MSFFLRPILSNISGFFNVEDPVLNAQIFFLLEWTGSNGDWTSFPL